MQLKWLYWNLCQNNIQGDCQNQIETTAHYKFIVSYDGTDYCGFQVQGNARTVQQEIEIALRKLGWLGTSIIGAGRTDSGVHADGQVFSASIQWRHGEDSLRTAMNAKLPPDIAILKVEQVEDQFHARFDAMSRRYQYRIYISDTRLPMVDRYAWRLWFNLNLERLNTSAAEIVGEHDFRAFGSAMTKNGSTVRAVYQSQWEKKSESEFVYNIEANAFLYHMVRRVVYSQISLHRGRISQNEWKAMIYHGANGKPGLAPPNGLRLVEVQYLDKRNCNDASKIT